MSGYPFLGFPLNVASSLLTCSHAVCISESSTLLRFERHRPFRAPTENRTRDSSLPQMRVTISTMGA